MKTYSRLGVILIIMTTLAAQCGAAAPSSAGPDIEVRDASARASIENGVIYLKLVNQGNGSDKLLGAQTDVAEATELHETSMDEEGVMRMTPMDSFEVPANGSVTLEPGGKHIMLIGLNQTLSPGDKINLALNFEQMGPLSLQVGVDAGPTGHDHGDDAKREHTEDMGHGHDN